MKTKQKHFKSQRKKNYKQIYRLFKQKSTQSLIWSQVKRTISTVLFWLNVANFCYTLTLKLKNGWIIWTNTNIKIATVKRDKRFSRVYKNKKQRKSNKLPKYNDKKRHDKSTVEVCFENQHVFSGKSLLNKQIKRNKN